MGRIFSILRIPPLSTFGQSLHTTHTPSVLFRSIPFTSLSHPRTVIVGWHCMRFMLLSVQNHHLRTPAAPPDPHSRSLSQPNPELNCVIHDVHVHSITMTTPAVLTSRLRTTGQCPPSLLDTDGIDLNDEFLKKVSNLVQDGKCRTVVLGQSYVRRSLIGHWTISIRLESLSHNVVDFFVGSFSKCTGVKLGENATVEEFQNCMKVS
jgi:hypothetical protein